MNILVTGGAGFIGSHIVDAYLADGHTVAILDNYSTGKRENHADVTVFEGDITSPDFVRHALEQFKPEVISHHAAQVSVAVSAREPLFDAEQNILGMVNILEAARQLGGVKKVIYASSGGTVYGEIKNLPGTEELPKLPVSPYGQSKYVAEEYLGLYTRTTPMKATILRYGNVYGPRQDPHGEAGVCAIFAQRMLAGEPCTVFGDGSLQRDYVYVGDVVEANLLALRKGDGEAVNISTGVGTTAMQVFETLKHATNYSLDPVMAPFREGDAASNYHSPAKAEKVLGWKPATPFTHGIAETVAWYREQIKKAPKTPPAAQAPEAPQTPSEPKKA